MICSRLLDRPGLARLEGRVGPCLPCRGHSARAKRSERERRWSARRARRGPRGLRPSRTVAHRERTADVDERGKERAKKAGLAFLGDDDEAQAEDARQNTL